MQMCPEMGSVEETRVCENQDDPVQMAWANHAYSSDVWTWGAAGSTALLAGAPGESQGPSWVAVMAFCTWKLCGCEVGASLKGMARESRAESRVCRRWSVTQGGSCWPENTSGF